LAGWLAGWLASWLAGWLAGWLAVCFAYVAKGTCGKDDRARKAGRPRSPS